LNILLTGAEGFTGRYFCEIARSAGHDVSLLEANILDRRALQIEISAIHVDAVVHLAAISFIGHADSNAFYSTNVIGTMNLLDALLELRPLPNCVLLASSANVYGNAQASPINEVEPPAPVNHYAMSKLAMEHMSRTYMDRLPIVIARPFNYTGHGQSGNFLIPKLVNHFAQRSQAIKLGNLHIEREFNDVRMICTAYMELLRHGVPGDIYNICSGQPYALTHVIELLSLLTDHQIDAQVDPALVRANEVLRLCGDDSKLRALLKKQGTDLLNPPLDETLQTMLSNINRV